MVVDNFVVEYKHMSKTAVSVSALMAKNVLTVDPDAPVVEAAELLLKSGFNGIPVVDKHSNRVVGILTEYDLTIKGSSIHLPTFLKLLSEFQIYKKDKRLIKDDVKKILNMKVKDVMNTDPLVLPPSTSVEDAMKAFAEHHRVNPIPIVEGDKHLVGILSRSDMVKLLGTSLAHSEMAEGTRGLDLNVNKFLNNFEKRFVMVKKSRTYLWFVVSLAFLIVGFVAALFLFVKIR